MTGYQSKRAAAQDKLDSMEREALKLAQQVMESLPGFRADIDNALDAIKEALAQSEPTDIAALVQGMAVSVDKAVNRMAQRPWVGLTNDEVNNFAAGCHLGKSVQGAIYEAETKLKQNNT